MNPRLRGKLVVGAHERLGLGVLTARRPPLVGRDSARDRLWGALCSLVHDGRGGRLWLHGAPGVGTSRLAQGPTAHSCLVRVAAFDGPLPEVGILHPPEVIRR